ncbi:MAG: ecsB [Paenibacillus sp.]|nr:ecsB [Paenibacillus sp.]
MKVPTLLWQQRHKRHTGVVMRYTRDMGRSGFFSFLMFAGIALTYFYSNSLQQLPDDFPYTGILTLLLLPVIAVSPVRTLLREADSVFLLPLESRMSEYFRAAFRYSFIGQAVLTAAVVTLTTPLYRHGFGEDAASWWSLLFFTLALKLANLLGNWKEASLTQPGHRGLIAAVRWVSTALVLVLLIRYSFATAGLVFLLLFAGASLLIRFFPSYKVHWTQLLARERKHQSYFFLFFSWFTDVEELPTVVKRRRWLTFSTRPIRFDKRNSFVYLYAVTLIRSELTSIILRLLVISIVLVATSTDRWMAAILYIFFALIIHVQLSALREYHSYAVMPALYPLPSDAQRHAVAAVAFRTQLIVIALLTVALVVSAAWAPWMPLLPAAAVAAAIRVRHRMRRARAA